VGTKATRYPSRNVTLRRQRDIPCGVGLGKAITVGTPAIDPHDGEGYCEKDEEVQAQPGVEDQQALPEVR
jgi:hypothetical protein